MHLSTNMCSQRLTLLWQSSESEHSLAMSSSPISIAISSGWDSIISFASVRLGLSTS